VLLKYESNLKEHRERKGFTQERLAQELGVTRQTVVNIEKGLNEPKVLLAIAIAGLLGVAVVDLFRKKA
jgi:putative transcriptional regulator